MTTEYPDLIASPRVSTPTRQALAAQAREDDAGYAPQMLDAAGIETLRAMVDRIIPQSPPRHIDLAARIDQRLARGSGDGWRFATLPADPTAYRLGLLALDRDASQRFGAPFSQLAPSQQDELLTLAAAGRCGGSHDLTGAQLRDWFEDVCADAVRLYVAHPQTMAHLGYSGIANGGDGMPKAGFLRVGLGEREDWEPTAPPDEAP